MVLVALELQQSLQRFYWAITELDKRDLIRRGQRLLKLGEPKPSEYPERDPDERELDVNHDVTPTAFDLEWLEQWKRRELGWP